jgi:hypothetical protein
MTTSNEHNNAPAVPQGEPVAYIETITGRLCAPLDEHRLKFPMCYEPLCKQGTAPAQGEPFGYFRAEPFGWTDCSEDAEGAIALYEHPAHEKHWTENEPVRLPSARTDRVYLAGPMTGIAELNFPAFNQEAERLRAEGLQVLNPADHGIVDGADWADYLRHDIAGLSSCERIHLLRGWTKSKGACLEMTIAKALGMTVTYQVDAEMEHNNAPAVPQGWKLVPVEPTEAMSIAGGIAWESSLADDVIGPLEDAWAAMLAATPAPAPAQEVDEAQIQKLRENGAKAWAGVDAQQLRAGFAAPSQEPVACGLCQGSGVLSPTQKCICQYGGKEPAQEEVGLILSAEDVHAAFTKNFPKSRISQAWINFAADIAQAIAARAAKPAQDVGLTDEQKTWAVNQLMEQAQVFASAWSLVGGRYDFGNALEEAEQAKTELRSMVVEALRAKGGK